MNRYESAYRDYTIPRAGDESSLYPQRPERTAKGGRVSMASGMSRMNPPTTTESSESGHDSFDQTRMRIPPTQQGIRIGGGFSSTDEDGSGFHQHVQPGKSRLISSRELSDRSVGGERSNPDFLVANDAIQSAYQRSPALDESGSTSEESRQQQDHQHVGYYNNGTTDDDGREMIMEEEVLGHPEIYIPQPEYFTRMPTSELSHGSYRTYRTGPGIEDATLRSKTSKRGGIVVETTRAPHPMCPNTRSCCCLMLLFNLGLLLVCLGFVIVLQLNDPPFVWYLGVFMLVFGFVSLIIGLIFCAWMCREGSPDAPLPPNSELYWTHHWRKTIYMPEHHGRVHETNVKVPIGEEIHYVDESDSYRSGGGGHRYNTTTTSRY